jgi:basic membrane protein A and related proteins
MLVADLHQVAREYPETHFAIEQKGSEPNVAYLTSVDSEPSYLAGAVAAMTSRTGVIGYIGGVDWEHIWQFQAGYEAGARAVDPDIRILADYLTVAPDLSGFQDSTRAKEVALSMYGNGADVIFHAAGDSGLGLFDAAAEYSVTEGGHVWAIGVDSDQYQTVTRLPGATRAEAWKAHILTSVLKGIEAQAYTVVAEHARGEFHPGEWTWGLESGASDLSYSGGYIDDIRDEIEALKAGIIAGEIEVPCIPESKLDEAAVLGIGPDDCHD